ncbi:MAG: thioesterase [Thermoleophilia bacterium]|nr:thioesterase [Thermoleophilia bacterium]
MIAGMPLVLPFRFPLTAWRAKRRSPVDMLEESTLQMRVQLLDCDYNFHVNNGRYLSLMDLGRTDHIGRTGLLGMMREKKWHPVAGGVTIRFRRELRYRTSYTLRTRCVGWADGWWFFEQVFERANGDLAARAYAKVAVLGPDRERVTPATHGAELGMDPVSPELPDSLQSWLRSEHG